MDQSTWRLLLQYRWCKDLGVCIGCCEPVKNGGIQCSFCRIFKYCSRECLDKDRHRHKPACDAVRFVRGDEDVIPGDVERKVRELMCRVKLLDSDGTLISPSVMQEVHLVNSSSTLSKVVANLITGSRSDVLSMSNSESTDDAVSRNENESVYDIECKSKNTSINYTVDNGSTSDTKQKNDIECMSDNRIMRDSGSISDSGAKSDSGKHSDTRYLTDSGSMSDNGAKSDSGRHSDTRYRTDSGSNSNGGSKGGSKTCKSKVQDSNPGQKFVKVTLSLKPKDNTVTYSINMSEVFQQGSSRGAETSPLHGRFNIPDHVKQHATSQTKHQQSSQDSKLKDSLASQKQSTENKSSVSRNLETNTRMEQSNEETNQSSGVGNSTAVDRLPNHESHPNTSASSYSSNSHSSSRNVSHSKSNETNVRESFGSGWWGKTNKISSRKSTAGNKSNKLLNSDENSKMENVHMQTSHSAKVSSSAEKQIPDSIQSREPSGAQRFGSGWWQGHSNSTTSQHEVKLNSQQEQSSNETKQHVQSNHQRTRKTSEISKGASKNDVSDNKVLGNSDSSRTTSNNCALGSNASTNSSHNNTSPGNDASGTSADRKEPESDNFGSGWWKHPTKRHNTGSGNSTKSTTDQAATKVGTSKCLAGQNEQSDDSCSFVNTCTDVSPYEIFITLEHILRFAKVASCISSSLVHREATHGRVIVMGLISVPGLWRASLGGSHISLIVEIVMRLSSKVPGVIVRDKLGHIAPVLFNTSESTTYTVPGTRGLLSMTISECLKPGTFVLLRAVNWEHMLSGRLIIVIKDMRYVDFIFYELI